MNRIITIEIHEHDNQLSPRNQYFNYRIKSSRQITDAQRINFYRLMKEKSLMVSRGCSNHSELRFLLDDLRCDLEKFCDVEKVQK